MRLSRVLSLIGMVLVLATGSVTMAMARHQAHAVAGQIVICSGYGFVTISVDAEGNPTGPMLPCPDCVPAVTAAGDGAVQPLVVAPETVHPVRFEQHVATSPAEEPRTHRHSRAPPVTV
jgi:hypothetical protein